MAASLAKLQVIIIKRILVHTGETSEANASTPQQLVVMLPLLKKSQATKIWARSNDMPIAKTAIMPASASMKRQKTSVVLGNLRIYDWG